jgi:hypothetical protein
VYANDPGLIKRLIVASKDPNTKCKTILLNDSPIAVLCISIAWNGVGEAWSVTTDGIEIQPFAFVRTVKNLIAQQIIDHGLHRVQMTVRDDYEAGNRFAQFLGFKSEGVLKKYGPDGADYRMYARFPQ